MMYKDELQVALEAARKAGDFLLLRENIEVDSRDARDIKLSSDRLSEKIIIDILKTTGIPILSEESGFIGEKQKYVWIVDPIDGTSNYFKGMSELSCVSIALSNEEGPILGVINRFAKSELYYGVVGQGAFLNGKTISPSKVSKTENAVMATGFPVFGDYSTDGLQHYIRKVQYFKKTRMLGAAALMSTFVANGAIDAYFEDGIMIWDVAAGVAITKAAGGSVKLELLQENKCICQCFANAALMEDYYAKGL
ncbi:myo-inositol-1(or 4)-monophosphatase [Paenibacillus cellulosilyticus]|uniref:Myo-inositol-1(Or 4)-monophosphatase n=1 Tax=Paenibacillus cellulosilyticus TaxID=375489 RepID=A0A2V2YZ06_9BACL|nr:inositol monophosphatase family protein [Paenibacillus cellulosilyticus]PWW08329.1 myo-inositol-1(or 4)-monophosphatase [Paenibacillus cellulosilyticus]QKS47928.1 inositol monophosphatase [Paenibacillus cellulosilyticus]